MAVTFGPARYELDGPERGSYKGFPLNGQITDTFGTHAAWRRNLGLGPHSGIDIAASAGAEICAPAPGEVITSTFDGQLGYYVTLRHEDDTCTGYAHLLQPSPVWVGARVERGQVIGRVGESGAATGPHLHWVHTKPGNRFLRTTEGLSDPLNSVGGQPAPEPVVDRPGMRAYTVQVIQTDASASDDLIVTMDIDEYVKGVLPCEMAPGWPLEALKAQAVAAKSYAIAAGRVFADARSQVYGAARFPDTDAAAEAVRGLYLGSNGAIVMPFYFGRCSGRTRQPSEAGWNAASDRPYLRGVPCACGGREYYGHGIGMCQTGARVLAEAGASFEAILRYYYSGIEILGPGQSQGTFAAPASSARYVVKSGDTLGAIAARFRVSLETVIAVNRAAVPNPDLLQVGQVIVIPRSPQVEADSGSYVVQPGDVLSVLAGVWGRDVDAIVALNGIADPNHIEVGQRLSIPV